MMASSDSESSSQESTALSRSIDRLRVQYITSAMAVSKIPRALLKEKKRAQARLDAHIYPIHTLPPEIMSEIFTHTLPAYPHRPPPTGFDSPTLLSHVCRAWRDIALSTPELWRAIAIHVSGPSVNCYDDLLAKFHMLETWLERSGCCPLSISVRAGPYPRRTWGLDRVVRTLVAQRHRWEYLRLVGLFHHHHVENMTELVQGDMPLLREVQIDFSNFATKDGEPVMVNVLQNAPRLRSIFLLSNYVPAHIALPWSQFTHFTAKSINQRSCSALLQKMPGLIYCKVELLGENPPENPPIVLERLETLILQSASPPYLKLTGLLASLTLPSLRRLHVPEVFLLPDPVETFSKFVSRSGCSHLKNVKIVGRIKAGRYRETSAALQGIAGNARLVVTPTYTAGDVDSETDDDTIFWEVY